MRRSIHPLYSDLACFHTTIYKPLQKEVIMMRLIFGSTISTHKGIVPSKMAFQRLQFSQFLKNHYFLTS